MAVQSKTLVNDLGSAVVDELASQMNRASCSTPFVIAVQPHAGAGSGAAGDVLFENTNFSSGVMFHASEACLVTNIKLALTADAVGGWVSGVPATTALGLFKVPATWTDTALAAKTALIERGTIHGSANTVLGSAGTYELLFASIGTNATNALGAVAFNTIFDLFDITAHTTEIPANTWVNTLVAVTAHAATPSKSLSTAISMNAGDSLVWALNNDTGDSVSLMHSVGYRPVKDQLNLSPSFTQKTFATKNR